MNPKRLATTAAGTLLLFLVVGQVAAQVGSVRRVVASPGESRVMVFRSEHALNEAVPLMRARVTDPEVFRALLSCIVDDGTSAMMVDQIMGGFYLLTILDGKNKGCRGYVFPDNFERPKKK